MRRMTCWSPSATSWHALTTWSPRRPSTSLKMSWMEYTQKQKALCPHCKKFVLHKPDNCTKLKANKDKHWPGWKSVHAIAWQAPGTPTVDLEVAANLVTSNTKLHTLQTTGPRLPIKSKNRRNHHQEVPPMLKWPCWQKPKESRPTR